MNYVINIKPRHLILAGIIISILVSKTEKDIKDLAKRFKKGKFFIKDDCVYNIDFDDLEKYTYCPCCGKKIKDEES